MRAERIESKKNLLDYRQKVGLEFDKARLDQMQVECARHYEAYFKQFGRKPPAMFHMVARNIGQTKSYKLYMDQYKTRTSKIITRKYKVNGTPVNWGSWRQFTSATDDSKARKEVFDTFVKKASILGPIVRARFDRIARTMKNLGTDPLSNYLTLEGISLKDLLTFVDRMGRGLKPGFIETLNHYAGEILGREAEYFDDYYFFRSRVFRKYEASFPAHADPVTQIVKTMHNMGLDATNVQVDDANRKGKSPSAFCYAIRIPMDIRLSYRRSNPLSDFASVFHEFGHGIHFSSIEPDASYEEKYGVPMGVAEIFSIFFESLMEEPLYLKRELGLSESIISDLLDRLRFNKLFFAVFYSANSMMKLSYWRDRLSIEEAAELYSDLTEKYVGIRCPGMCWLLHHVMPDYALYSPSYLIAAVRARELRDSLVARFGERYWEEKESGRFLKKLMSRGRGIELRQFSRMDERPFVQHARVAA